MANTCKIDLYNRHVIAFVCLLDRLGLVLAKTETFHVRDIV